MMRWFIFKPEKPMRLTFTALLYLFSCLVCSPLWAQTFFAIDLLAGSGQVEMSDSKDQGISASLPSLGIRGAFPAEGVLALEVSYVSYDEYSGNFERKDNLLSERFRNQVKMQSLMGGLVGRWTFKESWGLNARIGISNTSVDFKFEHLDQSFQQSFRDQSPSVYLGFGGQYQLSRQISLGADYLITPPTVKFTDQPIDVTIQNVAFTLGIHF
jgi:hypothetical protein